MGITRLEIRNYRGVAALEVQVPEHGAVASGATGRGKTTILRAIRAALEAQDIGADAIRQGTDRAEITVDLDDVSVRRVIGPLRSSVSVTRHGADGKDSKEKPKEFLQNLLGTSSLDPLELYVAKPKERRARILGALPITVTLADLQKYAPDLPADFDVSGHGLEVLERARKRYYDLRTVANREATDAKQAAADFAAQVSKATPDVPGVTVDGARTTADEANAKLVALHTQAQNAAAAEARSQATRARIDKLRADAASIGDPDGPTEEAVADAKKDFDERAARVLALEAALAIARSEQASARIAYEQTLGDRQAAAAAKEKAGALRAQADELEAAIGALAPAPAPEAIAHAEAQLAEAQAAVEVAKEIERARALRKMALDASKALAEAEAKAEALDKTVKALTVEAPAELLATGNAIPGLSLEGDEVLLDGKRLDALCGAEQLEFAVEIARRANARSKILIVDGLERLDPEAYARFVRKATADGYQLIGTRVAAGDIVIEAITPDTLECEIERDVAAG